MTQSQFNIGFGELNVEFLFDKPGDEYDRHFYKVGEEIRGKLVIRVKGKLSCKTFLSFDHRSTVGTKLAAFQKPKELIFEGTWFDGQVYEYPFSFDTENTPLSYNGDSINVNSYIIFDAYVSGVGVNYPVEKEVVILPLQKQEVVNVLAARSEHEIALRKTDLKKVRFGKWPYLSTGAVGLFAFASGIFATTLAPLAFLSTTLGTLIMVVAIYWYLRGHKELEKRTGRIGVKLETNLHLGMRVPLSLTFVPKEDIVVKKALASLMRFERKIDRSGVLDHKKICEFVFTENTPFRLAQPVTLSGEIEIPEDCTHGFIYKNLEVYYEILFELEGQYEENWQESFRVRIGPQDVEFLEDQIS